ncbi:YiiX/YebB-like N1pC/P60 family cysteine hydrolase [Chitiniphilus shinanonensis]|nr:YiiX/YebB-like N1pC/P60 family cysteine hydrolase [Chitiniphilus shinanonensis]
MHHAATISEQPAAILKTEPKRYPSPMQACASDQPAHQHPRHHWGLMRSLQEIARNAAASHVIQKMSTDEQREAYFNKMLSMSDDELNVMAQISYIPEVHWPIFRAVVRRQDCDFMQKLKGFDDQLETGDVVLMTGTSFKSKALAKSQIPFYFKAKSSHVALVHADFICIDAMPDPGVSNRIITDVLQDVEDNWRVIRFNKITNQHREAMQQRFAFYIEQPYKISSRKKPGKDFSYCSELARKVYQECKVDGSHIPKGHHVIKPCDFDRIADQGKDWTDITEKVRPYIAFVQEYEAIHKMISKAFIDGLKLNRARYEDRIEMIRKIRALEKKGCISSEKANECVKQIHEVEKKLHYTFWDFSRT